MDRTLKMAHDRRAGQPQPPIKMLVGAEVAIRGPAGHDIAAQGDTDMEEHETRRKIIRQWMALPKDKRQTEKQVATFAEKVAQENEFQRGRRDPYQKVMGWLLPRAGKP